MTFVCVTAPALLVSTGPCGINVNYRVGTRRGGRAESFRQRKDGKLRMRRIGTQYGQGFRRLSWKGNKGA